MGERNEVDLYRSSFFSEKACLPFSHLYDRGRKENLYMKPPTIDQQSLKSHGVQTSVSFGIKASGLHHILGILRNQLYSDKVLAVIREYTCNAIDAHTAAGCPERPIQVGFPNQMNPNFTVRDFGPALSEQEIHDVYAFYGESTKRNTNDQIGMLGIGSKSAFSYGDNFIINSFLNGKKYVYNAFIDPSQIGQISQLVVEDTKEENGIEIVVPVLDKDANEFLEKGKKLFKWFNVRPIIKGVPEFQYDDNKVLFAGDNWRWYENSKENSSRYSYSSYRSSGQSFVVMGNIGYPIDEGSLNVDYSESYRTLLHENLVLDLPIGDLDISASREKLQYTELTRKNIKNLLLKVQKEMSEKIEERFKGCKTLFQAKCLYGTTFDTTSPLYALRDVVKKLTKWNNQVLDSSTFNSYTVKGVELCRFKTGYRGGRYRASEHSEIDCRQDTVVIENDYGHRHGLLGRILPLIIEKKQTPFLIKFANDKVKQEWMKDQNYDGDFVLLSSLPKRKLTDFGYGPKSTSTSSSGAVVTYSKDSKHSASCFEFDSDSGNRGWEKRQSNWWKIAKVDVEKETGIYVIIDQFKLADDSETKKKIMRRSDNPVVIEDMKNFFQKAGLDFPSRVFAVKVKDREKFEGKEGWVTFGSWIIQSLKNVIESPELHQSWTDVGETDKITNRKFSHEKGFRDGYSDKGTIAEMIKAMKKIRPQLADEEGAMCQFLDRYAEMSESEKLYDKIKNIQLIISTYEIHLGKLKEGKRTHDIVSLFDETIEKYLMFKTVEPQTLDLGTDGNKKFFKVFANYVNVIDICDKQSRKVK